MKQQLDIKNLRGLQYLERRHTCSESDVKRIDFPEDLQEYQEKVVRGLVSVIMPVYNTEKDFLVAAIKSVQEQTYKKIELIVVDDGSECQCAELCDKLVDNRTRVYHIKNVGASAARNKGIQESFGEYLAFIDSDDTIAVNAIEVMVEQIDNVDFVACGCKHVQVITDPKPVVMREPETKKQSGCIEYLCYMTPRYNHIESNAIWGKLYRRSVMEGLSFDTHMVMAEDFKFNFDYIMRCSKGKYLDFIAYNYLEREDSISRNFNPKMISTIEKLEKIIHENENSSIYNALISRCINIAFTILMLIPPELKDEKERVKYFIKRNRSKALSDKKTKTKVRAACLISYISFDLVIYVNSLMKKCRRQTT